VAHAAVASPGRRGWFVSGTNGENLIRQEARTQTQAWRLAVGQAVAAEMLPHDH
jgi:hypothetical protein